MHSASEQERLEAFEDLCRRQGLPLTVQRRTILEAVLASEDHPTAEQVYEAVRGRLPSVSRTTAYRVLDMLVRLGVINRICHPGAAARFDPKIHQHHHLVCLHCEKILVLDDQKLNALMLPTIDTSGYEIDEYHIHFRGTCTDCLKKLNKEVRNGSTKVAKRKVPNTKKAGAGLSKNRRQKP